MSNECKKLFGLMNFDVGGAVCNFGLEQELFFVPIGPGGRDLFSTRDQTLGRPA